MELTDRSKAILSTILVLTFLFMLLLAAEGLIRVRQYIKYGAFGNISDIKVDSKTGLRVLEPGNQTANISINSHGFRGPEIEHPKPENRLRLAFLGASTTYCAEVSNNDAVWTELVRDSLEEKLPGVSIDYVNGGVPGYTAVNSLTNLETRIAPLDPDVVVIYHATNDLSKDTRELAIEAGIQRANLATEESWLGRYSLLWHLVEKNLALMNFEQKSTEMLPLDLSTIGEGFRRDLIEIVETARASGVQQVVLVTFSIQLRENMDELQQTAAMTTARYYMPYLSVHSVLAGFKRYNEIIREVAKQTGAILIENENSIPGDPRHFADSVHFKDMGSQKQAERIVAGLLTSNKFHKTLKKIQH
jgi:lysophospholipase L1-like esterase